LSAEGEIRPRLIAADHLKALSARDDARGLMQLARHLGLLVCSTAVLAASREIWFLVAPAMLLHGWILLALFAPEHETAHFTAFTSRRVNTAIGWTCGLVILLNWHYYQLFHFAHHRHTQDPARDPELSPPAPTTRLGYLWRLTGWPTWSGRMRVLALLASGHTQRFAFIPPAQATRVIASARAQLAVTLGIAALAIAIGRLDLVAMFWIGPLLLAQPPIPLSKARANLEFAPQVEAVVMKGLSRQPGDRYPDVSSFAAELRSALLDPRSEREEQREEDTHSRHRGDRVVARCRRMR